MSAAERKKAEEIASETKMVVDLFELPSNEVVVQNYRCAYWKEGDKLPSQGRMYITPRYCCWAGSLSALQLRIQLSSVSLVHKEKALLGLSATALEITSNGTKYHFRTFAGSAKRDEAHDLLAFLSTTFFGSEPPADGDPFRILLKQPNGQFHEALLLLREDSFAVFEPSGLAQLIAKDFNYRKTAWSYNDIETIQMRARPLHIDIRFNDGSQRFRLACAHPQPLVVRLVKYAEIIRPSPLIDIVFEPGIEKFDPRGVEEDPVEVQKRENEKFRQTKKEDENENNTTNSINNNDTNNDIPKVETLIDVPNVKFETTIQNDNVKDSWRRVAEHEDVTKAGVAIERVLSSENLIEFPSNNTHTNNNRRHSKPLRASNMTAEEIMAEASRNAALERQRQAEERQRRRELRASLRGTDMTDVLLSSEDGAKRRKRKSVAPRDESDGCCSTCLIL